MYAVEQNLLHSRENILQCWSNMFILIAPLRLWFGIRLNFFMYLFWIENNSYLGYVEFFNRLLNLKLHTRSFSTIISKREQEKYLVSIIFISIPVGRGRYLVNGEHFSKLSATF